MKKFNKNLTVTVMIFSFVLAGLGLAGPITALAATDPGLGAAATFSVLAQTGITGISTISGDVGLNSTGVGITALTAANVAGTIYSTDGAAPSTAILSASVQANVSTAYTTNIPGQGSTGSIGPVLDGLTLTTGVYDIGAGRLNGGVLHLNGPGVYIFRASSDFASSGSVSLENGARACDVYWNVNSLATIDGSSFVGTILAGTGVHFGANVTLDGRALAVGGDVTMITDTISGPSCAPTPATLHIVKQVVNTGGGTATASLFNLHVKLSGTDVAGSPAAGTAAPGTLYSLTAGTYVVSEDVNASYTQSFSAFCPGGSVTLLAGTDNTCTITNTYIPPTPAAFHVIKLVVNGNGGTAVPSDFNVYVKISGTNVLGSPANGTSTPGTLYSLIAGTYVVSEDANTSYVQTFSGDCNSSGSVTLSSGNDKTCTIINTDIPAPAPVITPPASVGGGGGGSGGGSIVPVIGILKVPTPLVLPAGPGSVTYNYTVWNVGGQQALAGVKVTDDKCSPVTYLSGDLNGNGKLDPGESWKYSCTATLSQTTTNTSIATGHSDDSNAQAAIATAVATVVVGGSLPAPLINVVKVPSRLTPFPPGGGDVTYTYTVTNPGLVAMNNVVVTDNKCAPVTFSSGDVNGNNLLDPGETWIYTCRTNVPVSTRNVATAEGRANGFTAIGYAFATVLVSAPTQGQVLGAMTPGLPNTGFPPEGGGVPWNIVVLAIIVLMIVSTAFVVVLKKRTI